MNSIPIRVASLAVLVVLAVPAAVLAQFPDQWIRDPANPILPDVIGSVILFDEGVYKMWGEVDGGFGYATSPDGRIWEIYSGNPVLVPGPEWYDENEIASPAVVIVDGTYHMWYSGVATDDDNRISHATSPDGIEWAKDSANPVMDLGPPGSLDSNELIHPFAIYEDPLFRMWYNGHDGSTQRILHAVSLDGVVWARDPNPSLEPGSPGEWDDDMLAMMCVLPVGSFYYMFYTGMNVNTDVAIGYAFSRDGSEWFKRTPSEPVLSADDAGAWDDFAVAVPVVLQTDTEFVMWYTGGRDFESLAMGVATASLPPASVPAAGGIRLEQNYPNPFNPQTTITFSLEKDTWAKVGVYELTGRRVAILADQTFTGGAHSLLWNGCDTAGRAMPSGTYLVRLETGSGVQAEKVMLVR